MTGWNPEIVATVDKVIVDARNKSVTFQLGEDHCANMTGAIRCALRLLKEAVVVVTLSGEKIDTIYAKLDDGWAAIDPNARTMHKSKRAIHVQGQD